MSRGSRGGSRGGRGGGARGGRPNVPWDTGDEPDARPSELFPPYAVPEPRNLTDAEKRGIQHLLLLRHQIHSSPLYTARRTLLLDPTAPRKMYGQAQRNALYGVRNQASLDPFTSVQAYSHRFVREERALPDWSGRPICSELFPAELLETMQPSGGARKRRRLDLGGDSLPSAEEAFGMIEHDRPAELEPDVEEGGEVAGRGAGKNLLEKLEAMGEEEAGDEGVEAEDEEGVEEEDEDEVYDDEDAGDYDAENYFDNGDDGMDDYGDGDEGEGTY